MLWHYTRMQLDQLEDEATPYFMVVAPSKSSILFYSILFSSLGRENPPIGKGWLLVQKGNKDSVTTPNQFCLKALLWRRPQAPPPKKLLVLRKDPQIQGCWEWVEDFKISKKFEYVLNTRDIYGTEWRNLNATLLKGPYKLTFGKWTQNTLLHSQIEAIFDTWNVD